MAEEHMVYTMPFPKGITVEKYKRFLEEESKKANVSFDTMVAGLYEGGMIDTQIWELLQRYL